MGRLADQGDALFVSSGSRSRSLIAEEEEYAIFYARSNDLPLLVESGMVDIALTGLDYVKESGVRLREIQDLELQSCDICLLTRSGEPPMQPSPLIASQYPRIAQSYCDLELPTAKVISIAGAAELYLRIGSVDGIVDAVMTGDTASANEVQVARRLFHTSGRLFSRPGVDGARIAPILRRIGVDQSAASTK